MARFDNGVLWYEMGVANVAVGFPEGELKCKWCKFLRSDTDNGRHFCRLTDDIIFSKETIADTCPLEFNGMIVGDKRGKKDV